jgi:hypothetical protein
LGIDEKNFEQVQQAQLKNTLEQEHPIAVESSGLSQCYISLKVLNMLSFDMKLKSLAVDS